MPFPPLPPGPFVRFPSCRALRGLPGLGGGERRQKVLAERVWVTGGVVEVLGVVIDLVGFVEVVVKLVHLSRLALDYRRRGGRRSDPGTSLQQPLDRAVARGALEDEDVGRVARFGLTQRLAPRVF